MLELVIYLLTDVLNASSHYCKGMEALATKAKPFSTICLCLLSVVSSQLCHSVVCSWAGNLMMHAISLKNLVKALYSPPQSNGTFLILRQS